MTRWLLKTSAELRCSVPASNSGRANFVPNRMLPSSMPSTSRTRDSWTGPICWQRSSTDGTRVPDTETKWIDVKRTIYLAHAACEAVLIIEQDRMEVRLDVKSQTGWSSQTLGAADDMKLPAFGLRCAVTDVYEGTPLQPRRGRKRSA